jgi:small-conductance mechanosensitive channel
MTDTGIGSVWGRLDALAPVWAETSTVLIALVVLFVLRRFVSVEARGHARAPAAFLLAALLFRAVVPLVAGLGTGAGGVLGLLGILCLVVGLVGIGGLVVFDLALRQRPIPAVVRDLSQIVVVIVVFVGILFEHGFDPISLAATGGVLTAVIGFALQSTIANVFAGVALPLERQLGIGDWIEVGGAVGRIREIKWRSTAIVTKDGDTVIVPNNQLITTYVTNYSRPTPAHRVAIQVGFHYRHPPNEVRAVLLEAVRGTKGVLQQPAPDCFPIKFDDSAVTYVMRVWVEDYLTTDPIQGEVRARIWYAARRAGLEIPYPIHTIVQHAHVGDDPTGGRMAALDRIELFRSIDGECRDRLANEMREQHFGAGEDIIRQNDPGDSLFIIAQGAVDVRVAVDGARRSVATLSPGQFFGEMSLMTGEPRQATCRADDRHGLLRHRPGGLSLRARLAAVSRGRHLDHLAERQTELDASREDLTAEALARSTRDTRSRS